MSTMDLAAAVKAASKAPATQRDRAIDVCTLRGINPYALQLVGPTAPIANWHAVLAEMLIARALPL